MSKSKAKKCPCCKKRVPPKGSVLCTACLKAEAAQVENKPAYKYPIKG